MKILPIFSMRSIRFIYILLSLLFFRDLPFALLPIAPCLQYKSVSLILSPSLIIATFFDTTKSSLAILQWLTNCRRIFSRRHLRRCLIQSRVSQYKFDVAVGMKNCGVAGV
ncbi:hypothetical protein BX666DRAFT_175108 [Dichotomocladium elegans]|nr:hypothetical protein BX666DRAFT_175108 [Dichotomocladium elegans]